MASAEATAIAETMRHEPGIHLPAEYSDPQGLVRLRRVPLSIGPDERQAIAETLTPGAILAVGDAPSFQSQIGSYITHQEIFQCLMEGGLMNTVLSPTPESVSEMVADLPFEASMRFLGSVQKAVWYGRLDRESQRALMHEVYGSGLIAAIGTNLLNAPGRVMFTEQQVFALMRVVVLNAAGPPSDFLSAEQRTTISLALLFVPGTILEATSEGPGDVETLEDERWLRLFIGNGGLVAVGNMKHDVARAHAIYSRIAKTPAARRHHDYCDLEGWLRERYGLGFLELQGLGFALYAGSRVTGPEGPPVNVRPDYFRSTRLHNRLHTALDSITAEADWFRARFQNTQESDRRAAFEIYPFLQKPCLRQADGNFTVLSPRGIESWLSSTGTYYRLLDIARERGQRDFHRFLRFNGWLQERYVRQLAHVSYPTLRATNEIHLRRVIPEQRYAVGRNEMLSNDVTIDFGTDLVLFEVTAKRLTAGSVVDADSETIARDIRGLVVEKMEQLGRVIRHIREGRIPVDALPSARIWPVIVVADGVFQSPALWEYVQREGGHHLHQPRVKPLVIADLEEYERLMGLAQEGNSLVAALERKTSDLFVTRDVTGWHRDDPARIGSFENRFIDQELNRAFRGVIHALGLRRTGT